MAATRRNAMLIEEARSKIRTTQLLNRLSDHALGKIEMSPTQVKATEVLLRKILPDLTAVEGKINGEITQRVVSGEPLTPDEWESRYANGHANGSDLGTTTGATKSTH